jgi:hypothetical protein
MAYSLSRLDSAKRWEALGRLWLGRVQERKPAVFSGDGYGVNQGLLTIKALTSPACFFDFLAAFFSFGVSTACFFVSLLDRWDLDIVFTPIHVNRDTRGKMKVDPKGICPDVPISPPPLGAGDASSVTV